MAMRRIKFATNHDVGGVSYKKGQVVTVDAGLAASLIAAGAARVEPQKEAVKATGKKEG